MAWYSVIKIVCLKAIQIYFCGLFRLCFAETNRLLVRTWGSCRSQTLYNITESPLIVDFIALRYILFYNCGI